MNYWFVFIYTEIDRIRNILVDYLKRSPATRNEIVEQDRLDVTKYFFVSTKLAARYPNMLESFLVLGYNQSDPGSLSQAWVKRDNIFARLLNLLKYVLLSFDL